MKSTKAIVTLVIGKHYRDRWNKLCAANWSRYAELHGYKLICIDSPLDDSSLAQSRSACWQKCLVLGDERVQKYDRVVWIDSDILINPNSPCIVAGVPEDKVGAVEMFARLSEPLPGTEPGKDQLLQDRAIEFWGWLKTFRSSREFYSVSGLPDTFDSLIQSGVMVLSPRHHRSLLEYTYYNYKDAAEYAGEMQNLSYEVMKANCVHWLDSRFNRLWVECMLRDYPFLLPKQKTENRAIKTWKRLTRTHYQLPPKKLTSSCLTTSFINNYFLHFAGVAQYMAWVDVNIASWSELREKFN